jgi:hypothetical protein
MKFIVDKMPNYKEQCYFSKPYYEYKSGLHFTCKLDNKDCNLQEGLHVQYVSCR